MDKITRWEKQLRESGFPIITWDHEEIKDYLLACFKRDYAHYLQIALSDTTKRHKLVLIMNHDDLGGDNFGGTLNYNTKRKEFTHISYSDRHNWAVQFSINSGATFFAYEYYKQFRKDFPFGISIKKLSEYLLSN